MVDMMVAKNEGLDNAEPRTRESTTSHQLPPVVRGCVEARDHQHACDHQRRPTSNTRRRPSLDSGLGVGVFAEERAAEEGLAGAGDGVAVDDRARR